MNILFVFADQMHRYAMGCMGTQDIHTPNLDAIAGEGVMFRNAYSNCPVCTPFRINLFTGQYSSKTDTFKNAAPLPQGVPTLAGSLNEAGYRTAYVGKWHIGGAGHGPVPRELRGDFGGFVGYQCYNGFRDEVVFYDEHDSAHRYDGHRTDVTTNLAVERMEDLADGPFALFVSYQAPHYPEQPSAEYEAMYDGVTIRRRPNSREIDPYTRTWSPPSPWPPDDCPDFQRYGNNLDEYLRLYYGMVSQVDAGVGRLLEAVRRLGVEQETVVIFTADHGDMQGSQGLKNKCFPNEESSGIPLLVRTPGGLRGAVSEALVSGVDFFPTCLDFAGLPPMKGLPGNNFAALTRGEPQRLDGPVFSEMPDWKMVRVGDLKLVTDGTSYQPEMLFDLARDPYETVNLVGDDSHSSDVARLRRHIVDWQSGG